MTTKKSAARTKFASDSSKHSSKEAKSGSSLSSPRPSSCCMGTTDCSTNSSYTKSSNTTSPLSPSPSKAQLNKSGETRIVIKYDVGFNNQLFLRGKGANLSWDRGIKLRNIKNDEWVWETDLPFSICEFKVLINDQHFEQGENHRLTPGAIVQYTPSF